RESMPRDAARIHFDANRRDLGGLPAIFRLAAWTSRMDIRLNPDASQTGPLARYQPKTRQRDNERFLQLADVANVISFWNSSIPLTPTPLPLGEGHQRHYRIPY